MIQERIIDQITWMEISFQHQSINGRLIGKDRK